MKILQSILAGTAIGVLGCNQSSPPAVVATPVTAEESSDRPKTQPVPKNIGDVIAEKNEGPIKDGATFAFPDDAGGEALAKTLTPRVPNPMPASARPARKERVLPQYLDAPSPTLADASDAMPRLPLPSAKPARPTPLPDRVPVELGALIPQLPPRAELQTGPLTRQESRDISKPAELPQLSQRPVADRAPLTDPTLEFTAQSVISTMLPLRIDPTGFIRINLPDPFENADAAKPRTPVVDDPNRSLPR